MKNVNCPIRHDGPIQVFVTDKKHLEYVNGLVKFRLYQAEQWVIWMPNPTLETGLNYYVVYFQMEALKSGLVIHNLRLHFAAEEVAD